MPGLKTSIQLYILAVAVLGAALLGGVWITQPPPLDEKTILIALLMLVINLVSERYVIRLPRGGDLVPSTVSQIASIFILPLPVVVLVTAASTIIDDTISRKAWYKAAFNAGQFILAVGIPAYVVNVYGPANNLLNPGNALYGLPVVIGAVVLYYAINTVLTNTIIALDRRTSVVLVWLANNSTSALLEFGMGIIGVLWAFIWLQDPFWSLLALCPAIMACSAFSRIRRLEDENEQGIIAIADTIDARDPYTFQHSKRVAVIAGEIAEEMNLNSRHVEIITSAARLHDLGKMGITNEILHKPGNLNSEDWETMRLHPEIGANILSRYHFYKEGLDCVLHHHERYDGRGYPNRLRGEQIPIGARILTVADAYEAMTSDRPYRKGLSADKAVDELKRGIGTQFDPMVAATFLKILDKEARISRDAFSSDSHSDSEHGRIGDAPSGKSHGEAV